MCVRVRERVKSVRPSIRWRSVQPGEGEREYMCVQERAADLLYSFGEGGGADGRRRLFSPLTVEKGGEGKGVQ